MLLASILLFAQSSADPAPERRHVFSPQALHAHASSLVEAPNGDLFACWYRGSGERRARDVRVEGARLAKGADAWSDLFLLADTPQLADCNPVLFVDSAKRLWLFWIVVQAGRWEHSVLEYRRADDWSGPGPPKWSWQGVIHLVPGDRFAREVERRFAELDPEEDLWAEYAPRYSKMLVEAANDPIKRQTGWMTRVHPIALPSGRIVLPLYSDGFNLSLMALSDDGGETWRASLPIVGLGPVQPSVVRRRDGELVAWMRDAGNAPARVQRASSSDEGESWSIATDSGLPNPGSSLEVITLRDGRWALVSNDTENGRHRLSLALSSDEGETWTEARALESAPPGSASYSYPSLIQTGDGRLHLTYSYAGPDGESIRHASLDAAWIDGG